MATDHQTHEKLKAALERRFTVSRHFSEATTGPVQAIHDIAVSNGSACDDPDAPAASGSASKTLQALHDTAHKALNR
jgi:hypothetical protein